MAERPIPTTRQVSSRGPPPQLLRDSGQPRDQHGEFAKLLPGGLIHSRGLMHRVVDDRRAGWVTNWEQVADAHRPAFDPEANPETETHSAKTSAHAADGSPVADGKGAGAL